MDKDHIFYKPRERENLPSIILYWVTPFSFMINPLLFVICVTAQLILQVRQGCRFPELFIVLMLNGFLYSSVSLAGLRFYDWIIIFSFIYVFMKKRGHIKAPICVIVFGMSVFLVFFFHGMETNEILEVVRYFISALLILIVLNTNPQIERITKTIIRICKVNLYNALVVFILIQLGRIYNYTNSLISTNIYIFSDEVRLNGFFSDPNKYMTFCLALIFIIELFIKDPSYKKRGILISSVATVLSMSRTALLCLALYLFLKLILKLRQKYPVLYWGSIMVLGAAFVMIVAMPDFTNNVINGLYTTAAKVLGREHTLEINATLQDDNRVYIWKIALEFVGRRPLFGNGWLAYQSLLPYPTHNTVISLLLDGGGFMLAVYMYTFWPLFFNKRFDMTISCVILPMLLLDLGNYRVLFLLLSLIMLQRQSKIDNGVVTRKWQKKNYVY